MKQCMFFLCLDIVEDIVEDDPLCMMTILE